MSTTATSRRPSSRTVLDQSLFAQMTEVAAARIGFAPGVVAQVARGHDPKRADGRQRARLRAAQGVLAFARVVDDLSLASAWQVEIAHEDVARITMTRIVARGSRSRSGQRSSSRSRGSGSDFSSRELGPRPRCGPASSSRSRLTRMAVARIVVAVARVVTPSRIVKHAAPPGSCRVACEAWELALQEALEWLCRRRPAS